MKKSEQSIHPGIYAIIIVAGFILVSTLAFAAHFEDRDANSFYAEQIYSDFEKNYAGKTVKLPFAAAGYRGFTPLARTFNQPTSSSHSLIKAERLVAAVNSNSPFVDFRSINCAPEH